MSSPISSIEGETMENSKLSNLARKIKDKTLDRDIEKTRLLGYRSIDLIVDYLKNIDNMPISPEKTFKQMIELFYEPLPQNEQDPLLTMDECREKIMKNALRIGHPCFLGWTLPSGTATGAFADGIASAINQNVAVSGACMATAVELCVLRWIKELIGYDPNAGGILVSGGSNANLTALAVARNVKADFNVPAVGMRQEKNMKIYASKEVHMCIPKAADLLGIGTDNISWVDVDKHYRMDSKDLEKKIQDDIGNEHYPFAVIATAGTVNTGAIDPLKSIANICHKHNLWFHIDAAYGGFAAMSKNLKPLLQGIESADSVALDPHKWLFIPYEAGCILIKNPSYMTQTFSMKTHYIHLNDDVNSQDEEVDFSDYGLQLSRGFRALKIWMTLKHYGIKNLAQIIDQNVYLAQYFAEMLVKSIDFELVTPVSLSVVCFRYVPNDLKNKKDKDNDYDKIEKYLSVLNKAILSALHKDGQALLSGTVLNSTFVLRICIVNYRTKKNDLVRIIDSIRKLGRKEDKKFRPSVF